MKTEAEIRARIASIIDEQVADGYYDDYNDGRKEALRWVLE